MLRKKSVASQYRGTRRESNNSNLIIRQNKRGALFLSLTGIRQKIIRSSPMFRGRFSLISQQSDYLNLDLDLDLDY